MGVDVIYTGDINPCKIKVFDVIVKEWRTGEVKNICARAAMKLTQDNINFSLVFSDKKPEERQVTGETKEELDIDSMKKDELLDLTANEGIEADYSMTKKELKELLNAHYGYEIVNRR